MARMLYVREGSLDASGAEIGFEAEEGSLDAKSLLAAGYVQKALPEPPPPPAPSLEDMTLKQLLEYAEAEEIDTGGAVKKADVLAAIVAALEARGAEE